MLIYFHLPSIESFLVTIQMLWHDIIATPMDAKKLTNLTKYGAQDPYLKTDGNKAEPPP
jgi:hypothetical protein